MAVNEVKTVFLGDTKPLEKAVADAKSSYADFAAKVESTPIVPRVVDNSKLNEYRNRLIQSQTAAAGQALKLQGALEGGGAAILRSVGLSENLSRNLAEAASKAVAVKTASEASAAATTEASAASALMSTTLFTVGTTFAAAAVAGLALVKASQDIRKESERRLAEEIAITAEWNKQINLAGELQKARAAAAQDRADDSFLQNAGIGALQRERDQLLKEYNDKAKQVADEVKFRSTVGAAAGPGYAAKAAESVGY